MKNKKRIYNKLYDIKPEQVARSLDNDADNGWNFNDNPPSKPEPFSPPCEEFYWKIDNRPEEPKRHFWQFGKLAKLAVIGILIFAAANLAIDGLKLKSSGITKSRQAMAELTQAKSSLENLDFSRSYSEFASANKKLSEVSENLSGVTGLLARSSRYIPFVSKLSSGSYLISAGKDISEAGAIISGIFSSVENLKTQSDSGTSGSYLQLFEDSEEKVKKVSVLLEDAQNNLEKVNIADIPEENRGEVIELKNKLPEINAALIGFTAKEPLIRDILGGNGPRKYLFLFQNNQEMRATGGFIGTYGILDIFNGRVRNFFIDGIFNPDGQLRARIVPPRPIQKISADWSLHDSNWFPDFPVSAEKAAWFYEKTGGPTVDGVITMTPTVLQKMLEATGPIEMPEYGVTVDSQNFIEKVQYEVEVDYDKELNQPKKILADLAPVILDRMLNCPDYQKLTKAISIINDSLNEKHILIYSKNYDIEKVISQNGWSGEILATPRDYVSVINTNINGFKTDGIVSENISHTAEIQPDGTIIDTLVVERKHNGGGTPFEWWNKVNADYMRIYVPEGSKLLSATGHTREFNAPPLDYQMLGYKTDPQVRMEEDGAIYDQDNGITVYDDKDKTVFAGWTYVSPKETMRLEIKYALPFKLDFADQDKADAYSLLVQKQSGSLGSRFSSNIIFSDDIWPLWKFPDDADLETLPDGKNQIKITTDLKTDKFIGLALQKS